MIEESLFVATSLLGVSAIAIGMYLRDMAELKTRRAYNLMRVLAKGGMPVVPCSKCGTVMPICEAHPLKIGHYSECRVEDGQVRSTVMDVDVDTLVCKECAGKIADELTMGVKE